MRVALVTLSVLLAAAPMAANWPQWRGPSGLGVSAESALPTTWSARENVAWSASLGGLGSSSPIIWGDQVFVTSQAGRARLRAGSHPMLARDDATLVARETPIGGQREEAARTPTDRSDRGVLQPCRWPAPLGIPARCESPFPDLHEKHNLATPTPVTDGETAVRLVRHGTACGARHARWLVWTKHLGQEHSPFDVNWGHGSSPILYKDLLILLCDHQSTSSLARARSAHGTVTLEGRPREGPRLV